MVLTSHILAGAVIGAEVKNIWAIFGLGLASHYLMDALPHWDYLVEISYGKIKGWAKVVLDILIGGAIVWLAVGNSLDWYLVGGVFFALLPDLILFVYLILNLKFLAPLVNFHRWIHSDKNFNLFPGLGSVLFFCLIFAGVLIS